MDLRAEDIIKVSILILKSSKVCSLLTTYDAQQKKKNKFSSNSAE